MQVSYLDSQLKDKRIINHKFLHRSWNATMKRILQRRGMQRINLYENRYNLQFLYRSKVKPYIVLLFAIYDEFDAFDPRPTGIDFKAM